MKIYADTSVFGGVFDKEFASPSKSFFELIDKKKILLATSAVVETEIESAPTEVQKFFLSYAGNAEIIPIDETALRLRTKYIDAEIVTEKSLGDALHVALATISKSDLIVSWNFRHIVHFDKIPKYNAVNILHGFSAIQIYSPLEVIDYEDN